jgi:hypothetical protein
MLLSFVGATFSLYYKTKTAELLPLSIRTRAPKMWEGGISTQAYVNMINANNI